MDGVKIIGSVFALIFVFLLVANAKAATDIINSLASAATNQTKALQGR